MLTLLASFLMNPLDVAPILVGGELCHPSRLMVEISSPIAETALEANGLKVIRRFPEIGYLAVETPVGTLLRSRELAARLPGVVEVDLDRCALPAYTPNDPMFGDEWHIQTIKADVAWNQSLGSTSATIAVIDTGVEVTHEDLAGNVWVNAGEIPGNGIDDDGNGYIDDVNGYDFAYNDSNPDDQYGHGTACAGLAAGVGDNAIGVCGVAPKARIMALKASTDAGYFYDSNDVGAYLYAAHNGAKVLSMSFFSDRVSNSERLAIDYCWAHGVLPVAASGNSNFIYPYYPGAYEHTMSVAATTQSNQKAGFSDFGSWVDVATPGVNLTTTAKNNAYTNGFAGTSGATPIAAGTAALLFGANPLASNAQVRNAIEDTATLLNQAPYGEFANYGLVNADAAMTAILGSPAPPRSPIVRYMTPAGFEGTLTPPTVLSTSRIYGRGFQKPVPVLVTLNGKTLKIVNRDRDWLDVAIPRIAGTLNVYVSGSLVKSITVQSASQTIYSGIEASTQGATLTGGYFAMLLQDTNYVNCDVRSDGNILVQSVFRRVKPTANMSLVIRRRYNATANGTEKLYLYDWTTASYPYGSFDLLSTTPVMSGFTTTVIPLTNPARYVDPEGTMYFQLLTDTVDAGGNVDIDVLQLTK